MKPDHSTGTKELGALSKRFREFAERECAGSSALYEHLSHRIAADNEMLALAAHCRAGQPAPNLFLGAVHFLLLRGGIESQANSDLTTFYPDLSEPAGDPAAAYPAFHEFCFSNRAEIIDIISSRLVQTNEIRRCSYLLPAFNLIAAQARHQPLSLVEIGTSAGLNLMCDAYSYRYKHGEEVITAGNASSTVEIECSLRGANRLHFAPSQPHVESRTGIDLNIIGLQNPTDALWLRALIWPEHQERVKLLQNALPIIQSAPLKLISGDGILLLPEILETIAPDTTPVIFHTHTINQFSPEAKERLTTLIEQAGQERQVFRLANDLGGGGPNYFALKLMEFHRDKRMERHLANVDGHGRWMEWLSN